MRTVDFHLLTTINLEQSIRNLTKIKFLSSAFSKVHMLLRGALEKYDEVNVV